MPTAFLTQYRVVNFGLQSQPVYYFLVFPSEYYLVSQVNVNSPISMYFLAQLGLDTLPSASHLWR